MNTTIEQIKADIERKKRLLSTLESEHLADARKTSPNDLEEAARYYLLNEHSSPLNAVFHQADLKSEMVYHKDIENAFIAGAKWQKEQMMKEAVPFYEILKAVPPGPERENVKLIICKED